MHGADLLNERISHPENGNDSVHRLDQIQRIIEDKFLAAGDILQTSLEGIDELVRSLHTFVRTFDVSIVVAIKTDLKLAAAALYRLLYHGEGTEYPPDVRGFSRHHFRR
jgi:hypothetical protein